MEKIDGVRVGMYAAESVLSLDEEGYVGSCAELFGKLAQNAQGIVAKATVEIRTSRSDIVVLSGGRPQDGLAVKRDLSRDAPEDEEIRERWAKRFVFGEPKKGERVYQWRVPVLRGPSGHYLKPHQNFVRVLEVDLYGAFSLWEVALVAQDGELFVAQQRVYETRCYEDGGVVVCPFFEGQDRSWPGLVEILRAIFANRVETLLPVSAHEPAQPIAADLGEGEGVVLFYSFAKDFGAIRLANGESALVRSAALEERPEVGKFRCLFAGERVSCEDILETDPDSSFDFEAVSVKVRAV